MCEFLDLEGADFREAQPNAGPNELLALWKSNEGAGQAPSRAGGQIRAQLREPPENPTLRRISNGVEARPVADWG